MFTGLFRRRETELSSPNTTPLEEQKLRQTESLRKNNPSIIELQRNEEFRLNVNTNLGAVTLNIYLPPLFPQVRPVISVTPPVHHPWVKDLQTICCPELLNFSMHSDLGKLVLGIVEEFQRHPPMALWLSTYVEGSRTSPSLLKEAGYSYDPNVLPSSLVSLKELSVPELQELNNDEDKLQEYIEKLDVTQKMAKEKEELNRLNEELARDNLSKQPVLEERKQKLLETIDTVSSLRQQFDENSHRQQILAEQYSPSAIQESLKFAALHAEEESEAIAEAFLDGKKDIEEFLSKFMDKRTLAHRRRAKEEKLHQQLMELKKSGF